MDTMNYESDVFLKDEGDIITVCFQTPKAIKALDDQHEDVKSLLYGSDEYKKLDVDNIPSIKNMMLAFAESHNLSVDSDL